MGRIILCNKTKASTPLYISRGSVNIYTIEELSYYLYNNMYLIDDSIINSNTFEWIRRETGLTQLADLLESMDMNIRKCVMTILRYTGYLSEDDIENAGNLLNEIEGQPIIKRKLIKCEYLLRNQRYSEAIVLYKNLIDNVDEVELEKLYNNMGTAYTGLFLYSQAIKYYMKAYEIKHNPTIYREILNALTFLPDEEAQIILKELNISENELETAKVRVKEMVESSNGEEIQKIEKVLKLKEDTEVSSYYEGLSGILREWKKDYIMYSGC